MRHETGIGGFLQCLAKQLSSGAAAVDDEVQHKRNGGVFGDNKGWMV